MLSMHITLLYDACLDLAPVHWGLNNKNKKKQAKNFYAGGQIWSSLANKNLIHYTTFRYLSILSVLSWFLLLWFYTNYRLTKKKLFLSDGSKLTVLATYSHWRHLLLLLLLSFYFIFVYRITFLSNKDTHQWEVVHNRISSTWILVIIYFWQVKQ